VKGGVDGGVEEGGKRKGVVRLSAMGVGRISFKSTSMWTHVSGWPEPQQRPVRFVYPFAFFSAGYGEEAAAICLGGDLALSLSLAPSAIQLLFPCRAIPAVISLFLLAYYLSIIYFHLFPYIYFYSIVCFLFLFSFPASALCTPHNQPPLDLTPPPDFLLPTTPPPITSVADSKPFLDLAETVGIVP